MKRSFTIHDLPASERPRERLQKFGVEALSAQEILALILGRGIAGESVMITAQRLLSQFGNLKGIASASVEELSQVRGIGIAKASIVHPREVFKEAISASAASVIFAHNHPSGDPEASEDDIELTKRLAKAGEIVGIEVLDHIIIGDKNYLSLKRQGLF